MDHHFLCAGCGTLLSTLIHKVSFINGKVFHKECAMQACQYCGETEGLMQKCINYIDEIKGPDTLYFCLDSDCQKLYHRLWEMRYGRSPILREIPYGRTSC